MAFLPGICPSCGAQLQVDASQESAFCNYCGTQYIVEKAIQNYYVTQNITNNNFINGATVNVGQMDADTMFENWLVSKNYKLVQDFEYYYATDPRIEFMKLYELIWRVESLSTDIVKYIDFINKFLIGERFEKYKTNELNIANERYKYSIAREQEVAMYKAQQDEAKRQTEQKKEIEKKVENFGKKYTVFVFVFTIVGSILFAIYQYKYVLNHSTFSSVIAGIIFLVVSFNILIIIGALLEAIIKNS